MDGRMTPDVKQLISFYKSPLGRIVRSLLRVRTNALVGDVTGQRVLGLGFATPYLRPLLGPAERVIAFMPQRQGASSWPREGPSRTVLCDPLEMPLTDASIDMVVAIHGLEYVGDVEQQMRELWRICAPNAQLVVVVPRRNGMWAQRDDTPFGRGNSFSRSQLDQLLRAHSFTPEEWSDALFLPPSQWPPLLKSARMFERVGRVFGSTLAGAMCVRARKQMVPAIARRARAERLVRVPDLAPQPAMHLPDGLGRRQS